MDDSTINTSNDSHLIEELNIRDLTKESEQTGKSVQELLQELPKNTGLELSEYAD